MTMRLAEDCCDAPPFNCDRSPNTIISVEKPRFRFSWATPPPKPILCRGRKKARNHLNADAPLGLEQEQDRCGRGGRLGRVGRLGPRRGKSEKKGVGNGMVLLPSSSLQQQPLEKKTACAWERERAFKRTQPARLEPGNSSHTPSAHRFLGGGVLLPGLRDC